VREAVNVTNDQGDTPESAAVQLRDYLETLKARAGRATSWLKSSSQYLRLINRDGVVPVTARLSREDLAFLARAREEMLGFAEFGLRILDLHQPLDAGGITSNPSSPIQRCRSCMSLWPCPTFRALSGVLAGPAFSLRRRQA
jgi:hypothetical protein